MSFTYAFDGTNVGNPAIANVRLLVADTDPVAPIFSDEEILGAYTVQQNQLMPQVIGGWPGGQPAAFPAPPVSPLRVAALLMRALASSQSRMQSVVKLLDVSLSPLTAKDMRQQADDWIKQDDEGCGFVVIEQCTTSFAFRDRWFSQWQRNGQGVSA